MRHGNHGISHISGGHGCGIDSRRLVYHCLLQDERWSYREHGSDDIDVFLCSFGIDPSFGADACPLAECESAGQARCDSKILANKL